MTPLRILVAEDSRTQAEWLRLVLQSEGWTVEVVADGQAAIARLEAGPPIDLVISDIVMPHLSGFGLCRRIKATAAWRQIPVLLLTSLTDAVDVIHALESGADSFLSKGASPEQLIARISQLVETKRLRVETPSGGAVPVVFRGQRFSVASGRDQILDLLVSTFEDTVRTSQEVMAARDQLAAQHEELLRVQRQKEELTALLVHDLKGPAAGIMMSADLRLRSKDVSELDRELWGHVHTAAEAINRMVMNMLDIARSEDGVFTTSPAELDVPGLIADVQRLMLPLAKSREQQIDTSVAPDVPSLSADPEILRRVLQNLVENAIRHSPVRTTVRINATLAGDMVRIAVSDLGSGIPSELRDRIFQKYVRLSPVRGSDDTFGRGLGLAFCWMAVAAHGGEIDVSDNRPRGTVFTVALPV